MKTTKKLELIPTDRLIPYENNARTHSDAQIEKIQASLREFGFVNPVIVDKDFGIIAGHCRVEAAKREGIKEIPCVIVEHLTEAQKKAYILADNRLALDAGWDFDILSDELEDLKTLDFGLDIIGFSSDELNFGDAGEEDPSDGDSSSSGFSYHEQYGVIVLCNDEQEQEKVYNALSEGGYNCKVVAT